MVFQRDLRVAVRRLLRNRAFAGINLTGLALATACSLLIFLYVQDELSFDRHHEHADRIVRVVDGNSAQTPIPLGPALTRDLPEVVSQVGLAPPTGVWILRSGDRVFYEHKVYLADPSLFDVFSIPLVLGNPDTALQQPFSMVLSESMAAKYFGDENPLGRTLVADDGLANMVVTGVMPDFPPNSHFQTDFFVPSSIREALSDWDFTDDWVGLAGREYTYLLLAANQNLATLEEKLPAVLDANLNTAARAAGIAFDLKLQPVTDIHLHSHLEHELEANGNVGYVYLLTAIALFVLLIACFNFMNLSTARTAIRAREVGVRKVVGAERAQLIRMFLGESVVLAVTAVAIATTIVWFILPGFNQLSGKTLSLASINPAVLILGLALLAGTVGMAAGSYPALVLSAFRPMAVLKGGLLASGGRGGLRRALVVVQFAISIGLMAGTIVLYSQLSYLQDRKLGFNKEQVVLFPTGVAKILDQYDALKSTLLQDPHIRSVTSASFVPGRSAGASRLLSLPVRLEDQPEQSKLDVPLLYYDFGFEKTFEFQLTAGRFFSDEFATDRYREALILNESAIRRLGFGTSEDAIGARIDVGDIFVGTVVGVVEDFHIRSLHHAVEPVVVMPTKANGSYESHVAMRIESGKASEALASIEAVWASFFPQLPFTYTFLDDDFQRLYDVEQRLGRVYAVFALIAIGIACLGLFGLASFMAERRTRETGIRKVLGASTASILNLLTREFLILVIVANVIAWPVTYYFLQQWLENFAYRTTVHWGAFLLAGVTAVGIAVATIAYQSIRAALGGKPRR